MKDWKRRVLVTLIGHENSLSPNGAIEFESDWEAKIALMLFRDGFPAAGKVSTWDEVLQPKVLGAMVGHKRSGWDQIAKVLRRNQKLIRLHGFSQLGLEILSQLGISSQEYVQFLAEDFPAHYLSAKRALRRCLSIAEDQTGSERTEFIQAHAMALRKGTLTSKGRFANENTTTQIHQFLLAHGERCQSVLNSRAELHSILCHLYGSQVIGDQDRLRKICERAGYKIGKVGRPPKKRDIGELMLSVFPPREGWNSGGHDKT